MKLVLLSGGSGKRLWPMSNDSRSKQFLKVLQDEQGRSISMLQRVWAQLGRVGLSEDAFICASKAQREMIEAQVGSACFIEEPARRDTFPAIALAVTYLSDVAGVDDEEAVAVCPIDHYVDDEYFRQISRLPESLRSSQAELALMGVRPTEPTNKFGYIRLQQEDLRDESRELRFADSFVEKPAEEFARVLIGEGALWNCGVFCFRLGYVKSILQARGLPTTYEELVARFAQLPKRSFDYEVVERVKSIVVQPYAGMWKDLGTWEALSEELTASFVGRGMAVECTDTHVINELGIPVVTLGLQNVVVVATPDGILVTEKGHSSAVKDVIADYSSRPMFEEGHWGSYRVLDYQKLEDGTEVLTKFIELYPGRNISYQKHLKRSEVWTFIEGSGEAALGTRITTVSAGDVIRVHPEQWHAIRAHEKLTFIEVQRGSELIEEDIVRRYLTWEEVAAHCSVASV